MFISIYRWCEFGRERWLGAFWGVGPQESRKHHILGGGFPCIFYVHHFSRLFGEDSQFEYIICFQMGGSTTNQYFTSWFISRYFRSFPHQALGSRCPFAISPLVAAKLMDSWFIQLFFLWSLCQKPPVVSRVVFFDWFFVGICKNMFFNNWGIDSHMWPTSN